MKAIDKKHYFITYFRVDIEGSKERNAYIDKSPVDWLNEKLIGLDEVDVAFDVLDKYEYTEWTLGELDFTARRKHNTILTFYSEITKEQYDKLTK